MTKGIFKYTDTETGQELIHDRFDNYYLFKENEENYMVFYFNNTNNKYGVLFLAKHKYTFVEDIV